MSFTFASMQVLNNDLFSLTLTRHLGIDINLPCCKKGIAKNKKLTRDLRIVFYSIVKSNKNIMLNV